MELTTLAVTLPYLLSIASLVILSKRSVAGYYTKIAVSIVTFAFTLGIIMWSSSEVLIWGFGLLLLGVPLYFWLTRKNSVQNGK
jgi:hypothetical protein